MYQEPTDEELEQAEADALAVWQYGDDDAVWDAIFRDGINVAAELLHKIENTPEWTVGDLTHEQAVASILRRYPLLGPPPHNFGR